MVDYNYSNNKEVLGLKVDGEWYIHDFNLLLKSIKELYFIFYAINELKEDFDRKIDITSELGEVYPFWGDYFRDIQFLYKKPHYFQVISSLPGPIADLTQTYKNEIGRLLKKKWYIPEHNDIRIKSIKMSSPGEIRLEAGSVLKEVRELIKDLSYRNSQERQMGELKIIQEQIRVLESLGIPRDDIGKLILKIREKGITLEDMLLKGKIGLIIDTNA